MGTAQLLSLGAVHRWTSHSGRMCATAFLLFTVVLGEKGRGEPKHRPSGKAAQIGEQGRKNDQSSLALKEESVFYI